MRAFVALELPDSLRRACADRLDGWRPAAGRIRLSAPENLHLTLAFLGDVEDSRASSVAEALRPVVAAAPRWMLPVRGCGAFADWRRPRVLWLGVGDASGRCAELHRQVWEALAGLGFQPEPRPFRPHVTIGRVRGGRVPRELRAAMEAAADAEIGVAEVRRVAVMRSDLEPGGARYREVAGLRLGG